MEYFLKYWGGAEPYIQKELGTTKQNFWFDTKEERDKFAERLKKYNKHGLVIEKREGQLTHRRTIAEITVKYRGKEYSFEYDFGYEYPIVDAKYMFSTGNYSCDCDLSLFIRSDYPDFPELKCGDEIRMVSFKIKYRR
jgi:hypothetical protein